MKAIAVAFMIVSSAWAARPETGVYTPTISSDFERNAGDFYPSALGVRPWKSANLADYAGRYIDIADAASVLELAVLKKKSMGDLEWQTDAEWKRMTGSKQPTTVRWARASVELNSRHSYTYGARGCFFAFFVLYRDPDNPNAEPHPAVLIGDRLLVRK